MPRFTLCFILRTAFLVRALMACLVLAVNIAWAQSDFMRVRSFGNPLLSAATPLSTPIEGSDGALYGTTSEGGTDDFGTVYKVNKDGGGLQVLHRFAGGTNDGVNPIGRLVEGSDQALYGTTLSGGLHNGGIIFRLAKDGSGFAVLNHLATGSGSQGSLLSDIDGTLYGTTTSTVFKMSTNGTGFTVLHTFGGVGDGQQAQFGVIAGSDGALYGVTTNGGANNLGTVFTLGKDGSNYAVLFSFGGTNGQYPQAGLLEGSDHLLYGTTSYRRTNSYGTIFQINKTGSNYVTLHDFTGANDDGWYPRNLIEGDDGALYGTCTDGGMEGQGIVFKLNKSGGDYTVLHHFSWTNNDGRLPQSGLLKASDSLLYGTTASGGRADYGALYRLEQTGSNAIVVASFNWPGGDGWNPLANLIEASDGVLYGTTFNGGSNEFGTVFRMNKDQSGYAVLHHFDWATDGAFPRGGVIEGANGALFGTAFEGGSNSFGTVFTLSKDGSGFSVLHHFSGLNGDGSHPQAALLQGSDGALYGTTAQGGSNGWGTVFTLNQNGSGFALLRSIPGTNSAEIEPVASLTEGSDGGLYGVAMGVGVTNGAGSVFRMNKNGAAFTNLHLFTGATSEGRGLIGSLVEGTNGVLFGTTFGGSSNGLGGVFKVNKDGSGFAVLNSFAATADARNPAAGLVNGGNGVLYGTAFKGSATNILSGTNWGAVFKLNQDGSGYKVVRNLSDLAAGRNPVASLAFASDGALYGTALVGGDMGVGTMFSLAEPPSFTGLQLASDGAWLQFQGVSSRAYAVQAATNLGPPFWQTLAGSATWTNGLFQFLDEDATNAPAKFYRAVRQ